MLGHVTSWIQGPGEALPGERRAAAREVSTAARDPGRGFGAGLSRRGGGNGDGLALGLRGPGVPGGAVPLAQPLSARVLNNFPGLVRNNLQRASPGAAQGFISEPGSELGA